jgi:hypothetical protein
MARDEHYMLTAHHRPLHPFQTSITDPTHIPAPAPPLSSSVTTEPLPPWTAPDRPGQQKGLQASQANMTRYPALAYAVINTLWSLQSRLQQCFEADRTNAKKSLELYLLHLRQAEMKSLFARYEHEKQDLTNKVKLTKQERTGRQAEIQSEFQTKFSRLQQLITAIEQRLQGDMTQDEAHKSHLHDFEEHIRLHIYISNQLSVAISTLGAQYSSLIHDAMADDHSEPAMQQIKGRYTTLCTADKSLREKVCSFLESAQHIIYAMEYAHPYTLSVEHPEAASDTNPVQLTLTPNNGLNRTRWQLAQPRTQLADNSLVNRSYWHIAQFHQAFHGNETSKQLYSKIAPDARPFCAGHREVQQALRYRELRAKPDAGLAAGPGGLQGSRTW